MGTRRRRRHGHDVLIVLLLGVLAVAAALAWIAQHLAVLAGVALLIGGAYYLGQLHGLRQARPGQVRQQVRPGQAWPGGAPAALPAVTLPRADAGDRDEEPGTRQPAGLQADRDSLLSDPRSGVRPLSQLRGPS